MLSDEIHCEGEGKLLRKTGQSWWAVAASIERKQIKLIDRSSWIRSQWASQWRIWLATKNTCQQADLKITKAPSKGHLPFHAHEGHTSSWANDQQWTTRGSTVGDQVPQCIVGLKRNDYTSGKKKHWIQHFFWGSQPGSCRSQKWIVFLYVLLTMHCLWSLYRLFRSESAASPIKTGAWSTIAHASRRKNHQDCMAHHSSPQVPCWIQNKL